MTNTNLLIAKIDESGFKRSYLAGMLGITPYSLANKIQNKTEFKASEIQKLCETLKIDSLEEREKIFFNC